MKPHRSAATPKTQSQTRQYRAPARATVDPRWLLKACLAVMAAGLLCAYLTFCGLFYTQQWQLVLHPSRAVPQTPASLRLAFEPVRFGDDLAGQPELAGWWVPSGQPGSPTALVLHGESGSLSATLPAIGALHAAGLNVLAFDYRGFGQSGGKHPTERLMEADSEAALVYLTETRSIPVSSIVLYGSHLGASLAVRLCRLHPQLPALVLDSADGDTQSRVSRDFRSSIVPVSLLFHQRFPLADALSRLRTPKLLISYTTGPAPEIAQRAADPKLTAEFPEGTAENNLVPLLTRFLSTYVTHPAPLL